jgi:hypothetical protein
MVPALAIALVVVGGAMALTFDRLWQGAAAVEIRNAGQAAALAAASRLASDDTLRNDADWPSIGQSARTEAAAIAGQNLVGGIPMQLDDSRDGDIRLGRIIENSIGERVFVETMEQPRTVQVRAWQGRGSRNPVGLLVRDLTGAGRTLSMLVEATADNRISGLRPYAGVNIPALPIAIAAGGTATPGWNVLIEGPQGIDTLGVNPDQTVRPGPDGIREMTAFSAPYEADEKQQLLATLHVIDIGAGLSADVLIEQCRAGWSSDDLDDTAGEIRLGGRPHMYTSMPKIPSRVRSELQRHIGEARLCWAFDAALPTSNPARCQVLCSRLIAVRLLEVQSLPDGMLLVHLQPAVVATRTAVVSETGDEGLANPYVYKVFLSQ